MLLSQPLGEHARQPQSQLQAPAAGNTYRGAVYAAMCIEHNKAGNGLDAVGLGDGAVGV